MAEHREIQQAWSDFIAFFHKHKNVIQELSPNQPAPPTQPGNVMLPGTSIPAGGPAPAPAYQLPKGVTIADELNGLISAEPAQFDNPDLAGQNLSAGQTSSAFSGQGLATIEENARDASLPGIHVKVWPMVANADGTFSKAPLVGEGTNASPPWLPNAWLINPKADLATALREFRLPTFIPAKPQ